MQYAPSCYNLIIYHISEFNGILGMEGGGGGETHFLKGWQKLHTPVTEHLVCVSKFNM